MGSSETGYQLGSDAAELKRLDLQGRVLAPATRTILQAAGVRPDMRVLDLGSGAGDVAFAAAGLAGPALTPRSGRACGRCCRPPACSRWG